MLILFVCANFHFAAIVRFNLFANFSLLFFREPSKPCPPNFAPPFCALCLNVYDFLPKTWDLGRKEGKFALSGGAPLPSAPVGRSHLPQGDGFRGGGKLCGSTKRLPLGGAGALAPEGVLPWELPQSPSATAPSRMGPLAWRYGFWLKCKVSGRARGSLLEGAGKAVRL